MSYTLAYQGAEIDDILGRAAPGGALDTAIAAKQDALTFDAVPTEGSTNPAESGGIYDAIQAGGAAALAAFATDSVSGDVVSFSDGASNVPVKSFVGSIIPVQDLHGQSAPYPAGGGKNKLPYPYVSTTKTTNGITFSDKGDGTITINGTSTGNADFTLVNSLQLPSGNYTFSIENIPSGVFVAKSAGGGTAYANIWSYLFPYTLEITDNSAIEFIILRVPVGITVSNVTVKPMIRLASVSDATFAPYSNICPISGWTGANIYRTGINVWDEQWEVGGMLANTLNAKNLIPVKAGETYCFHNGAGASFNFKIFNAERAVIQSGINLGNNGTYTMPSNAAFMQFRMTSTYGTTYNNDISINYPSTDTAYHAYNGQTILLSFGQTVYAGTLTALGGGLWQVQPTHAYRSITSADVFAKSANAQIQTGRAGYYLTTSNQWLATVQKSGGDGNPNGVSILSDVVYIGDTSAYDVIPATTFEVGIGVASGNTNLWFNVDATTCPDVASFKTFLDGLSMHICYPLATLPDPITITGEDLQTLLGANTVWTDVGSVTGMTYRADTALYIDKKLGA